MNSTYDWIGPNLVVCFGGDFCSLPKEESYVVSSLVISTTTYIFDSYIFGDNESDMKGEFVTRILYRFGFYFTYILMYLVIFIISEFCVCVI